MDLSSPILEAARSRLVARFGAVVEPWWQRLPEAVAALAARWSLAVGEPVGRGNTSLVIRCRRAGSDRAVLKLCPDSALTLAEANALRTWEPSGRVPALWESDATVGALLLEALPNEAPLSMSGAEVTVDDVSDLLRALHTGLPGTTDGIPPLSARIEFIFDHWMERHGRNPAVTSRVPMARLARGRELARDLAAHRGEAVLLHGDLHPGNVLDAGAPRGLVAIDPRPCKGDAAFDALDWVFWRQDDAGTWEARGAELASAVGCSGERLWSWCAAFAALLAAVSAARGGHADQIAALLALAP